MELYCAALLEPNERTRFVTAVSALEPLAQQQSLGSAVSSYVDEALAVLNSATNIDRRIRASLCGRINQLRQESVRQALFRLANSWFPRDTTIQEQIDHAYSLRSELLHEGTFADPDIDLTSEMSKIATVLRTLYNMHQAAHYGPASRPNRAIELDNGIAVSATARSDCGYRRRGSA